MKNVVVIGGGTGISTALRGLKQYTNPTAIVSMMDSGGSSGILRDEYGTLPAGDLMSCITVLSDKTELIRKLLKRYENGCLKGHTNKNILFASLGGDKEAIYLIHDLLKVKGKVCPVTFDDVHLEDMLEGGTVIKGEKNIDVPKHNPKLKIEKVWLNPDAFADVDALNAIEYAEVIIMGPGDVYTSIIPNLLVKGVVEGIRKSKAKKAYVCNLMTKYGETNNFRASDHVREIERYLGEGVLDYVICNIKKPPESLLGRYKEENRFFVEPDINMNGRYTVLEEKLLNKRNWYDEGDLIRHHPDRLAKLIMGI